MQSECQRLVRILNRNDPFSEEAIDACNEDSCSDSDVDEKTGHTKNAEPPHILNDFMQSIALKREA